MSIYEQKLTCTRLMIDVLHHAKLEVLPNSVGIHNTDNRINFPNANR